MENLCLSPFMSFFLLFVELPIVIIPILVFQIREEVEVVIHIRTRISKDLF